MLAIKCQLKPHSERRSIPFRPKKKLPFGKLRSDHMFLMEYNGQEWHSPRIVPYGPLTISPGAIALHYGQEIFEGAKAFKHEDDEIYLFRFDQNAARFNKSAEIMQMPAIPVEDQIQALETLVDIDRYWAPEEKDASLYIRPFMIGTEDCIGVRPSSTYLYGIVLSPSGPYYTNDCSPIPLLITNKFHRAAPGGTGMAKTGGNYGASLQASAYARKFEVKGVLYIDVSNTFLEEAGSMNHYHVTEQEEVVIPEFTDTILQSITARSLLELQEKLGLFITQRTIPVCEFIAQLKSKSIVEAGGVGTAAVISPVGTYLSDLHLQQQPGDITAADLEKIVVSNGSTGPISRQMYNLLTGIQTGKEPAPAGWLRKVPHLQ